MHTSMMILLGLLVLVLGACCLLLAAAAAVADADDVADELVGFTAHTLLSGTDPR